MSLAYCSSGEIRHAALGSSAIGYDIFGHSAGGQFVHRLARGEYAFSIAQSEAQRLGVTLTWRQEIVPGVGHDYRTR